MPTKFKLPYADNFSKFLEGKVNGTLTAECPKIVNRNYSGKCVQKWVVKLNGEPLGEYSIFSPKPGETEFGREFRGRIPGYVNECVAIGNKYKPEDERIPKDTVTLIYANQKFETRLMHEESGRLIDTPWQRQDFCEVPFP